jgi:cytochrome P450
VDLLEAYARRLPITVICEMLGVPEPDREWIGVAVVEYGDREKSDRVNRQLAAYLADLVAKKRADPADDLISALVRARDDSARDGAESRLNDVELLSAVYQLIMAGFDTTANLIASGTLALLTHPDQLARLREDPSLLPAAVEELLRFTNPVKHATDSFTTEDTRIGDQLIPTGEWILLATTL